MTRSVKVGIFRVGAAAWCPLLRTLSALRGSEEHRAVGPRGMGSGSGPEGTLCPQI